ncbi:hapless 2-like [Pollicipes pollicipes]|uniref:hapless 2-like n=1 Tax=Pollicipes pollicipes TaxID=41117 RepID=UPI001884F7F8|nr:hapless 2-like [Pollicipes pollicipes]
MYDTQTNVLLLFCFIFPVAVSVIDVKVLIKRCSDEYTSQSDEDISNERRKDEAGISEDDHFPGIVRRRLDLEQEFEMDEPEYPFHLTHCQRKLMISLWIKNRVRMIENSTDEDEQLIYIDHGYDDVTSKIVKLLSPVTIRFQQQPVLQAYPFRNIHVVNGLLHEEVVNKDETPNFTGCDDTSSAHPTCSYAYKKGKPIPYSQGFCCYCTASGKPPAHILAEEAQASRYQQNNGSSTDRPTSPTPDYSGGDEIMTPNIKLKPPTANHDVLSSFADTNDTPDIENEHDRQARQDKGLRNPNGAPGAPQGDTSLFPRSKNAEIPAMRPAKAPSLSRTPSNLLNRKRRQSSLSLQPRGGQDCSSDTPASVDPDKYLSSAHCLRLHDIWYNVNAVQMPRLRHSVQLQVYAKKELPDGSQRWSDLNAGRVLTLGTDSMHYMENNQTLVATYSGKVLRRENQVILNVTDKLLLIPQMTGNKKMKSEYPQLQGPGEYLLVSRSLVDMSGKTCDKIGATYSTFALQKDRCEKPRGSCLSNQPIQLWERDRRSGGALHYRLADFGSPHGDAIEVNRASGEYLLLMKHTNPYTSYVDVEVDADSIGILRTGLHAQITNVFTMSGEVLTLVTAVVTNTGLVSSHFSVQIASCTHKVPDSKKVASSIPPQNQVTFNITLSHGSEIIRDRIVCSALVRNSEHKVVAARRIHAYPHDRCVCVWFCLCACTAERFACTPMSLSHYRSSGFLGAIPSLNKSRLPYIAEIMLDVELVLISLTILGLLLGCLKAVIGVVFPDSIGLFGLAMCNDKPRKINHYYEPELRHFPVEYDRHGYPVHPLTKTPSVRRMGGTLQFCLNLAWFFYIPLACWYWVRKSRDCLPEPCARVLCCCPQLEGSPRSSLGARQSLLSDTGSVPADMTEHRAQGYGGVAERDVALDRYRQSRDDLRSTSNGTMLSSSSRPRVGASANSLSRASLTGTSSLGGATPRRSSSARSVTRTSTSGSAGAGSPGRSSASLPTSGSARRLSQSQASSKSKL